MEFGNIRNIAGAFFISTVMAGTAEAQLQKPQDYQALIECELVENGEITADFLEDLDSKIHGYDANLYNMTPEQREPYVQAVVDANADMSPEFIRTMFERPYSQYDALKTDEERVSFLSEKLDRFHQIDEQKLSEFVATCE